MGAVRHASRLSSSPVSNRRSSAGSATAAIAREVSGPSSPRAFEEREHAGADGSGDHRRDRDRRHSARLRGGHAAPRPWRPRRRRRIRVRFQLCPRAVQAAKRVIARRREHATRRVAFPQLVQRVREQRQITRTPHVTGHPLGEARLERRTAAPRGLLDRLPQLPPAHRRQRERHHRGGKPGRARAPHRMHWRPARAPPTHADRHSRATGRSAPHHRSTPARTDRQRAPTPDAQASATAPQAPRPAAAARPPPRAPAQARPAPATTSPTRQPRSPQRADAAAPPRPAPARPAHARRTSRRARRRSTPRRGTGSRAQPDPATLRKSRADHDPVARVAGHCVDDLTDLAVLLASRTCEGVDICWLARGDPDPRLHPERGPVELRASERGEFRRRRAMHCMRRHVYPLLLAIAFLASPSEPRAAEPFGTYLVSACRAGAQPAPLAGWRPQGNDERWFVDSCARGGSFGFDFTGESIPATRVFAWTWDAPADVTVSDVRVWRRTKLLKYDYQFLADGAVLDASTPRDDTRPWEARGLNARRLSITTRCFGLTGGPCAPDVPDEVETIAVKRVELLLRDTLPPEASDVTSSGSVASARVIGPTTIGATFHDRGGGVRRAALAVNGVERRELLIGTPPCSPPYTSPVPCPLSGRVELSVDPNSLAEGDHRVELYLYDVGGNRTVVGPYLLIVRGPASGAEIRDARLALHRTTLRIRYGRPAILRGTLTDPAGKPIVGVPIAVDVRESTRASAFAPHGQVASDASGQFSLRVPSGPSRTLRFRFGRSEAAARIVVPAPVRLGVAPKTTHNGRLIRFSGHVPATSAFARVELQARSGRRSIPFRTVALRDGRFHTRYRFTNTRQTARYRFRAVIHSDPDLPFAAGRSNVVKVLVRP